MGRGPRSPIIGCLSIDLGDYRIVHGLATGCPGEPNEERSRPKLLNRVAGINERALLHSSPPPPVDSLVLR